MSISILWQKFHNLVIAHIFLSIGSLLIILSNKLYLTSHKTLLNGHTYFGFEQCLACGHDWMCYWD